MSRKIVLFLVAVVSAAACVFLIVVLVREGLAQAGLWAGPLGALAGIVAAASAVWALLPRPAKVPLPPELEVPEWVVGRPAEMSAVVKALVGGRSGTVGITTGLYGAGGFGKTTLAQLACADRRVRRRFGGRVYLVTIGRDVRGAAAVAAKVNDVIKLVAGEDSTFTDPQLAGQRLGSLLNAGPRKLLVLDDVWEPEQLAPFVEGGKRSARLVTTRVPGLLAGRGAAVQVDQMSSEQARALLTSGLPQLNQAVVDGLLAVTGRWPLLLRLVNKVLADYARLATDVSAQGTVLLERLHEGGPAVVDDLLGDAGRVLDVGQPQERARAVRATIEASTSLLGHDDRERFVELGVFAEDETIPFSLVMRLWRATAGLDDLRAAQVCNQLGQLALISQTTGPAHGIALHDVIRDFLRATLGRQQLGGLNDTLLDTVASDLPLVSPRNPAAFHPARVAWWELGREERYMWEHLVEHLLDAGRTGDANAIACDLRWAGARLERFGPAAPVADLSAVGSRQAVQRWAVLSREAHLLAPTQPPEAVVDVLHSRVANDPEWGHQVSVLRYLYGRPRLVNHWALPDMAHPALRGVLTGYTGDVVAVVVAPDGSWLASGCDDGMVRIWDVATGRQRTVAAGSRLSRGHRSRMVALAAAMDHRRLVCISNDGTVRISGTASGEERTMHVGRVRHGRRSRVVAAAVAPDGSWLASGSDDGTMQIWDAATGKERAMLTGHTGKVEAITVAPDGTWLASGSRDQTVRIWDAATGKERATLTGHTGRVAAMAVAPDGTWLVSASWDGTARVWDLVTGYEQAALTGRTRRGRRGRVMAVAVAPSGNWLVSGSDDGTMQIWDAATGKERAMLTGHTDQVEAITVAPDGTWLASGSRDQTVRIWDTATGKERIAPDAHTGQVVAMAAAPDGSWLACGSADGTMRIWDVATGKERASLTGHKGQLAAMAAAPDGSWLASASIDGTVRIWDVATRKQRTTLRGHVDWVAAMAAAPDGSWLASGSDDRTVRIWDVATGKERAKMGDRTTRHHKGAQVAVAVAPDGSWLASGSADGTVRIWDVAAGKERATLTGHMGRVVAVAVAPDGNWLASGSDDGTMRIWDVATRQVRAGMRLDSKINVSTWVGAEALAVGGSAGLYLFDFLIGNSPVKVDR